MNYQQFRSIFFYKRNIFKQFLLSKLYSKNIYYDEADIEEKFLRGWGPGGQSVNKTSNAVQLKHLKTGIIIKNHDTRSLEENRRLARKILNIKLDVLYNGENAEIIVKQKDRDKKEREKYNKSLKRLEMKKMFKTILIENSKNN